MEGILQKSVTNSESQYLTFSFSKKHQKYTNITL